MKITQLDHLVITVRDLDATLRFYVDVLGMRDIRFGHNRRAVGFGSQKINIQIAGQELEPRALDAAPGTADLCFLVDVPAADVVAHLEQHGVPVELGPVERDGATGPITSVYVRDPDSNLVELSTPATGAA